MQYIRISDNDFCFARYDSAAGASSFTFNTYRLQPQMSVTANFREALSQVFFAAGSRVSTEILVAGTSVLVPLSEFQEEDCETIYGYCLPREEKCRVFYDTVPSANVVLLFSLPDALCRTLEDTLGSLRYTSSAVAVSRRFAAKGKNAAGGRRVFVYVYGDTAEVSVYEEARIVVMNSFRVSALSDVVYYTLSLAGQQSVDLSMAPVYVVAAPEVRAAVADELRRYAADVCVVNPAAEFNRHPAATTEGVPYDLLCRLLAR